MAQSIVDVAQSAGAGRWRRARAAGRTWANVALMQALQVEGA